MKLLLALAVVGVGAWFLLAGADGTEGTRPEAEPRPEAERPEAERRPETRPGPAQRDARAREPLRRARCPEGVAGCRSVTGRVVFVEAVDPDGDGDLHVVVAGAGISLPGLTAVDVRRSLRPRRDPRVGDRASAAGPVQRGSYGQRQIHAVRFAVER